MELVLINQIIMVKLHYILACEREKRTALHHAAMIATHKAKKGDPTKDIESIIDLLLKY